MEEVIEKRKGACAICLQILAPGEAVFPYGNALAHWECIEQEEHK